MTDNLPKASPEIRDGIISALRSLFDDAANLRAAAASARRECDAVREALAIVTAQLKATRAEATEGYVRLAQTSPDLKAADDGRIAALAALDEIAAWIDRDSINQALNVSVPDRAGVLREMRRLVAQGHEAHRAAWQVRS